MTSPQTSAGQPQRVPEVWGKVPPRNKNFTGREKLLNRLRKGIAGQVTAVVPHALHGLGGVGKTQMAVEYAYRYREKYDVVWWIPADQPVLVRSSLAGLAPHLGLPSQNVSGIEDAANAVLDALRRGEPYRNWLLIFDNADQPEDISKMIPQSTGTGHVLITSRNHRWEAVADTVAVDVFARAESVEFLQKRVTAMSGEDADRLAEALGDLPLALEQAGALQAETGMSVSEYLQLLEKQTSQILAVGRPTEYPASMSAAWALSVNGLRAEVPEALALLQCCAFFGPEPIPRDAFSQPKLKLGPDLTQLIAAPIRLSRAIGELNRYALAKLDVKARTLQVHRLIQALIRESLQPEEQERIRQEVHRLLAGYAPADPTNRANWERYANLISHIRPAGVARSTDPEVRQLAVNVVNYLRAIADYDSARRFVQDFLDQWTRDSGADHPDVLGMRVELCNVLRELGSYQEATELDSESLEVARRVLGPDHDVTLRLLRGEGANMRASGDFIGARERDEEALKRYQELGEDEPGTLRAINNLALDYALSSDYVGSRRLHEQAYNGQLMLDPASTSAASLLGAWSGLARAVRLCGDYSEAVDLGQDAYEYAVQELGPEHNWTLRTGKDLSIALRRRGEYEEAHELAQDVHARCVRLFGLDQPDTLAAAMCLANVRRAMGDLEGAYELAADTTRRFPGVYGHEHPYNHGCAGNLALMERINGNAAKARKLNETALAGLEAKLGRDHHYSLTVAINLATDLAVLGDHDSACKLGRGTLRRLQKVMGEKHPITLLCAANLSMNLEETGDKEAAATLSQQTETAYGATLGLEHPDAVAFLARRYLDADFDPLPI